MPQMAPIWWLSLFIAFSLILLIFICVNYYSFLPQAEPLKRSTNLLTKPL